MTFDPSKTPASHFNVADEARLAALRQYQSAYSPPEEAFDRLTRLAADIFDAPLAYINFIGRDKQWTKSSLTDPHPDAVGLDISFCAYNVGEEGPLVVEDAREDERFADNPLVAEGFDVVGESKGIRFYAGMPLTTPGGYRIGSICVLDTEPRTPDPDAVARLEDLAAIAVDEMELRAGYRYHEDILESITDAFFAIDDSCNFTYVNSKAEKWLERKRDELIGTNIWDAFPEAVDLAFHDRYQQVMEEQDSVQFESYFPPLERWFRVHAYPFRGGVSVYFSDVTERKQYEKVLKEAKQTAEEANASKSRFMAGVAHDLQTPLSVINMQIELLQDQIDAPHPQAIESMQKATAQLQRMARSLTDLAKLQGGQIDMARRVQDICPIVTEAVSGIEMYAREEHSVSICHSISAAPLYAPINKASLRRVIDNLTSNAVQYSSPGSTVTVEAGPATTAVEEAPGNEEVASLQREDAIRITVYDNGPGISKDLRNKLFEPYVRGDSGTGSGLGLTVVSELVAAMGGDIAVRSREGEGTAFYVFLPAAP